MLLAPERPGDIVLRAEQRQVERRIIVTEAMGDTAPFWGGVSPLGQPLADLLGGDMAERFADAVDFGPTGQTVDEVLHKVRTPHVHKASGEAVPVEWKIHSEATPSGDIAVELLIRPLVVREGRKSARPLASALGKLPNRVEDHREMQRWLQQIPPLLDAERKASLCLMMLEEAGGMDAISAVAAAIRRAMRSEDRVGILDARRVMLLLLDAGHQETELVLGRLRVLLARESLRLPSGLTFHARFAMAATPLQSGDDAAFLRGLCQQAEPEQWQGGTGLGRLR